MAHFGVGVAHVAGEYAVRRSTSEGFIQAGANRAHELGARTLKLFLTPDFRQKYPQPWPGEIDSLAALADSAPFQEVFALPFDTFVLSTYSFSMGTGDPWRAGPVPTLLAAEERELDALVTLLLSRYAGTGKTFVLQTWEGDWALLGAFDPHQVVPHERAERMAQWLSARHTAIDAARRREARPGVSVFDAIELNRVLDTEQGLRVVTDVLPHSCADAVSYSAWEALDVSALPAAQQAAAVEQRLETALTRIEAAAPAGASIFLGEFGLAENENTSELTTTLVERTLEVSRRHGVVGAVYWQMFDNECSAVGCRGLWVMRPDGSLGVAGSVLAAGWAVTDPALP